MLTRESPPVTTHTDTIELPRELVTALTDRQLPNESTSDVIRRLLNETYDPTPLEEFATTLANHGVEFMAVPKRDLAKDCLHIVATVPPETEEDVINYVASTHAVTVANTELDVELQIASYINSPPHLTQRVPLRVPTDIEGVESVQVEDGIKQIWDFVVTDYDPPRPGEEVINIEDLAIDLINAGAKAITVSIEEPFEDAVEVIAHMPAGTCLKNVTVYDVVEIAERKYTLLQQATSTGPEETDHPCLYVDDNWFGADPVPLDDGLQRIRSLTATEIGFTQ
jgi:hypothetical protein